MFLAPILLTITILVTSCLAWFGLLQKSLCSHQADRLFFVRVTHHLHQDESSTEEKNKKETLECHGQWSFTFEKKSIHHQKNLVMMLNDWGLKRESKR